MRRLCERREASAVVVAAIILAAGCVTSSGTGVSAALPASRPVNVTESRPDMQITRAGSQPSSKGPADWFTGTVRIDPLFTAPAPARTAVNTVTFEPGARTAWHTHPLGQTLIVLLGLGLVQRDGGPVEEIRPGDVVWIAPGTKHWHGASSATAMIHIAIQESLDGQAVEWLEHVDDAQYRRGGI